MASRRRKAKRDPARPDVAQPAGFNAMEIARAGRRVYERHRIDFERRHRGQYVLIDIRTEKVFLAESPEAAYRQAAAEQKNGPFYLVRVGERAAFRLRRQPNGDAARIAR
jgi:hypothetical protein